MIRIIITNLMKNKVIAADQENLIKPINPAAAAPLVLNDIWNTETLHWNAIQKEIMTNHTQYK